MPLAPIAVVLKEEFGSEKFLDAAKEIYKFTFENQIRALISADDGKVVIDTAKDISFYTLANQGLVHENAHNDPAVLRAVFSDDLKWTYQKKYSQTTKQRSLYAARRMGKCSEDFYGTIRVSVPIMF